MNFPLKSVLPELVAGKQRFGFRTYRLSYLCRSHCPCVLGEGGRKEAELDGPKAPTLFVPLLVVALSTRADPGCWSSSSMHFIAAGLTTERNVERNICFKGGTRYKVGPNLVHLHLYHRKEVYQLTRVGLLSSCLYYPRLVRPELYRKKGVRTEVHNKSDCQDTDRRRYWTARSERNVM